MKFITDYIKEGFFDNTGVTSAVNDKKRAQEIEKMLLKTFVPESKAVKGWYPIKVLNMRENNRFRAYLTANFGRDEGVELDMIKSDESVMHIKFTKAYKNSNGTISWNVYDKNGWNVYEDLGLASILESGPIIRGSVKFARDDD